MWKSSILRSTFESKSSNSPSLAQCGNILWHYYISNERVNEALIPVINTFHYATYNNNESILDFMMLFVIWRFLEYLSTPNYKLAQPIYLFQTGITSHFVDGVTFTQNVGWSNWTVLLTFFHKSVQLKIKQHCH